MIFGNINQLEEFPYLEEAVKECFEYAKNNDILSYEKDVTRLTEIGCL